MLSVIEVKNIESYWEYRVIRSDPWPYCGNCKHCTDAFFIHFTTNTKVKLLENQQVISVNFHPLTAAVMKQFGDMSDVLTFLQMVNSNSSNFLCSDVASWEVVGLKYLNAWMKWKQWSLVKDSAPLPQNSPALISLRNSRFHCVCKLPLFPDAQSYTDAHLQPTHPMRHREQDRNNHRIKTLEWQMYLNKQTVDTCRLDKEWFTDQRAAPLWGQIQIKNAEIFSWLHTPL